MIVAELVERLRAFNPGAHVRIGMFYGPGSPPWVAYEIQEVRVPIPSRSDTPQSAPVEKRPLVMLLANEPTHPRAALSHPEIVAELEPERREAEVGVLRRHLLELLGVHSYVLLGDRPKRIAEIIDRAWAAVDPDMRERKRLEAIFEDAASPYAGELKAAAKWREETAETAEIAEDAETELLLDLLGVP